jgi:ABC-type phosphate/phosphonate transport system substrate-binding protein
MSTELIANARMYSVAPGATAAWKRLFAWLDETSGVRLTVVDHAFPALLNDLWGRPDLAATFMCGWPWLRHGATHRIVAAPVPSSSYAKGQPQYCTHFVVHRDSKFQKLEDTFGHRFAYTITDSHSGYNAPRYHLMRYRRPKKRALFSEIIGPLTTPRRMLEAIAGGQTDVGPLDSFAFDLLSRHEPELAAQTRVIASTDLVPIPAIMASQHMDEKIVEKLAATLMTLGSQPEHIPLCYNLCISGFAALDPATYEVAERWARDAERQGLEVIT